MKIIRYQIVHEVNHGTEEEPKIEQVFLDKEIQCSDATFEANCAIAVSEAYNGEVTVEEVADEEKEPTTEERIAALEESKANQTDVDELTEALDMILAGVTE